MNENMYLQGSNFGFSNFNVKLEMMMWTIFWLTERYSPKTLLYAIFVNYEENVDFYEVDFDENRMK